MTALLALLITGCANIQINVPDSTAEGALDNTADDTTDASDVPVRDQGIWYAGGLATTEEGIDMKSACTNTFTITVVDKNGKTVVNQAKFKKN